jgi:hypothetical protein
MLYVYNITSSLNPPPSGSAEAVHHCCAVGSTNDGGLNVNTKELTLSSAADIVETQKESLVANRVFTFSAVIEPSVLLRLAILV